MAIKISRKTAQENRYVGLLAKYESSSLEKLVGVSNVIQLFDSFEIEGKQYLVTELCERGTLRDHMKQKKLTQDEVVSSIKQIMDGYKKIHERGIIHRDIKPSNMLIDKDGKIKISDFGFAIFQEDLQT